MALILTTYQLPDPDKIPRRSSTPPAKEQVSDWDGMVAIEPALQALFDAAAAVRDNKRKRGFCANAHWYGYGSRKGMGLKPRMMGLVGWHAQDPRLRSMEAYRVAYTRIYEALPDCRNCNCMGM
jgi:hypothetical protein